MATSVIPVIKPLPEYDNYLVSEASGEIFGLSKSAGLDKKPIMSFDDKDQTIKLSSFFRLDGALYFTTEYIQNDGTEEEPEFKTYTAYYKQSKGKVTNIQQSAFPDMPKQDLISYSSDKFEIYTSKYNELSVSDVHNKTFETGAYARFLNVSGCIEVENGLFFNVYESGRKQNPEGLYFFPIDKKSCSKVTEKGKMY